MVDKTFRVKWSHANGTTVLRDVGNLPKWGQPLETVYYILNSALTGYPDGFSHRSARDYVTHFNVEGWYRGQVFKSPFEIFDMFYDKSAKAIEKAIPIAEALDVGGTVTGRWTSVGQAENIRRAAHQYGMAGEANPWPTPQPAPNYANQAASAYRRWQELGAVNIQPAPMRPLTTNAADNGEYQFDPVTGAITRR